MRGEGLGGRREDGLEEMWREGRKGVEGEGKEDGRGEMYGKGGERQKGRGKTEAGGMIGQWEWGD